jgi:DNA topoisomerase-3
MEIDLRTGAAFTRFLTDIFKRELNQDTKNAVISYGPCQFPTLGFVVDRYKRYKNFKAEEFWYLDIAIKKDSMAKPLKFSWKKTRLFDRLSTLIIYKKCMDFDFGTITDLQSKPTSKYKPLPLTTVQLQKSCSLYFKMSAKESLEAAEKLYQQGFISYPRTETDIFPAAMNLKELIAKHTDDNRWGDYSRSLLENDKFSQPRAGKNDDKAHPPIHPVLYTDMSTIHKANEKKVYEFVVRHFLACCSMDAKGQLSTVDLKWGTELFTTSGLMVFERNFLDVYPYQKWESSNDLPPFELNERIKLHLADMKSGKTSPPTLMTETELIALMDANGIGTDATIAEHIEKIISREYITKMTKSRKTVLVPTILGMSLVEGFENLNLKNSLTKPFLRKNTETELKMIADGAKTRNAVCEEMVFLYRESFAMSVRHQHLILEAYQRYKQEAAQAA